MQEKTDKNQEMEEDSAQSRVEDRKRRGENDAVGETRGKGGGERGIREVCRSRDQGMSEKQRRRRRRRRE